MDPDLLEEAIKDRIATTGRTPKAIIPVALYGMPYRIDRIMEIADRYGIPVIEDAAEGLGSRFNGQVLGTFGKYGVLSFNGNKMITTSGGGALVCPDEESARKAMYYATQASDAGTEEGQEVFIDTDECLDGFYVVATPDEGMMLDMLVVSGMFFEESDRIASKAIHIAMEDIEDPEWGIFFEAYFTEYDPELMGIEEIGVDFNAADVEYFNLQGVRVAADNLSSGLYIARRGNKATKVLVK